MGRASRLRFPQELWKLRRGLAELAKLGCERRRTALLTMTAQPRAAAASGGIRGTTAGLKRSSARRERITNRCVLFDGAGTLPSAHSNPPDTAARRVAGLRERQRDVQRLQQLVQIARAGRRLASLAPAARPCSAPRAVVVPVLAVSPQRERRGPLSWRPAHGALAARLAGRERVPAAAPGLCVIRRRPVLSIRIARARGIGGVVRVGVQLVVPQGLGRNGRVAIVDR